MTWEKFKENYERGTILDITVSRKVLPAFIIIDFGSNITGSLHISELHWNFGLCQEEFSLIKAQQGLQVYIIDFNDEAKKVVLGRKALLNSPSNLQEWNSLQLNKPIDAIVFEAYKNKLSIRLSNGLYGTLPSNPLFKLKAREQLQVIPLRKNSNLQVIECTLPVTLNEAAERENEIVEKFNLLPSESSFTNADQVLGSFEAFSNSIYWKFLSPDEKELMEVCFAANMNLFSRADRGTEAIHVEFPFEGHALEDFIKLIGPEFYPVEEGHPGHGENELFSLLSNESFWYSQFYQEKSVITDARITSRNFTLFNNRLSIFGEITPNLVFRIYSIKSSENKDALADRRRNMKNHDTFLIKRPIVFYKYSSTAPFQNYNTAFADRLQQKIHARLIFQRSLAATIGILKVQGKDFDIFQEYLKNQIATETKQANKTEVGLTNCNLTSKLHADQIEFMGKTIDDHDFNIDEQVIITVKAINAAPNFFHKGNITMVSGREITITCPNFDFGNLKDGAYIKKVVSTRNHQVQLDVLDKFFENKLSLEVFYRIFYDHENIEPPEDVTTASELYAYIEERDKHHTFMLIKHKPRVNKRRHTLKVA